MSFNEISGQIEAMLFAAGEPVETVRLAAVMGLTEEAVSVHLRHLTSVLAEYGSGLELLFLGEYVQLSTKKCHAEKIRELLASARRAPLSGAAMEVLAIIAYNQPVTKAFCEQIRGVDCAGIVSSLCDKGLIEEAGRLELPGRPIIYKTTPDFLRAFSLESLSELPKITADGGDELNIPGQIAIESEAVNV